MAESIEKAFQDRQESMIPMGAPKKSYHKPKIEWEKKMEPIAHALTCALEAGWGEPCGSSPAT